MFCKRPRVWKCDKACVTRGEKVHCAAGRWGEKRYSLSTVMFAPSVVVPCKPESCEDYVDYEAEGNIDD